MVHVDDPQTISRSFRTIRWADSSLRRPNLVHTKLFLCKTIDGSVQSEIQLTARADMYALVHIRNAFRLKLIQLLEECLNVEDHTRADQVVRLGVDQARR